jgi:hypothetical protein
MLPAHVSVDVWVTRTCAQLNGQSVIITITGTRFFDPLVVSVAGRECSSVEILTPGFVISCRLPLGVGYNVEVVVSRLTVSSVPSTLLSYSEPKVYSVWSRDCPSRTSNFSIGDCPRYGGALVTVIGDYFGEGTPDVMVGGRTCGNLTLFNQSMLTCTLPSDNSLSRQVIVMQDSGEISLDETVTVSYFQCQPGFYQVSLDCLQCPAGRYTPVESMTLCRICSAGTFSPRNGSSSCQQCNPGQYQTNESATSCFNCTEGWYTGGFASVACSKCAPGKYINATGSSTCRPCQPGSFAITEAALGCEDCPMGRYSLASSAECTLCEVVRSARLVALVAAKLTAARTHRASTAT